MNMPTLPDVLKPRLRGHLHRACAPVALAGGVVLAILAPSHRRLAVLVYAVSMTALFTISATYHCGTWAARVRAALRRADHSTILVFIAGTFTPLAVTETHGRLRVLLLACMWGAAAAGVAVRMVWHHATSAWTAAVYAVVGISSASVLPMVWERSGVAPFLLLAVGGLTYLVGAVVYARRRPDPRPTVFGYHEVFHVLTVIAAALQYAGISLVVLSTPA